MKDKIIAKDYFDLLCLIEQEIELNGSKCDLNHIDVSNIKSMSKLFYESNFNGDLSQWDVSNVKDMEYMLTNSRHKLKTLIYSLDFKKALLNLKLSNKLNKDLKNKEIPTKNKQKI